MLECGFKRGGLGRIGHQRQRDFLCVARHDFVHVLGLVASGEADGNVEDMRPGTDLLLADTERAFIVFGQQQFAKGF